jgi:IclR family mhp operon transcriptional activator
MPNSNALDSVRAVGRSIAILQMINREGSASMAQIARAVDLPYATAYRLVQTLLQQGMIELEAGRKRYRPTELVHTLSCGARGPTHLVSVARPHLVAAHQDWSWPVSLVTRVGQWMMVCDSTHTMTSLTFNNVYPGYTLPITSSASGLAYLSYCADGEREAILEGLRDFALPGIVPLQLPRLRAQIEQCRRAGYAIFERNPCTQSPGKTSSIAAPILKTEGGLHGTLTFIFFSSALDVPTAVKRYAEPLRERAARIAQEMNCTPAAGMAAVRSAAA